MDVERENAGPAAAGPSILIVEDNADLADALSRLLRRMGYAVDVVHSGDAAVDYLLQRIPALVILDLSLPAVSGLNVLMWLRARPEAQRLPVIVYTADTDPAQLKKCIDAGATEIWIKGTLDFFEILRRLRGLCPLPEGR